MVQDTIIHLRGAGTSLVLDVRGRRLPCVLHWGRDLGSLDPSALTVLAEAVQAQQVSNTLDDPVPVSLLPEQSAGWLGTPGLAAHRGGRDFSTRFVVDDLEQRALSAGGRSLTVMATDPHAQVHLGIVLELHPSGMIRHRATIQNQGSRDLSIESLILMLPVPQQAQEILDLTGRHLRERSPQRHDFTVGTHLRENRRGRTGTDASLVLVAGEREFGFGHGQVWGLHVGWSGNHRLLAEATPANVRLLGGGEVLLPGEGQLAPGDRYESPWVYAAHGNGLDDLSARFHDHLRARPHHPRGDRPVTLNTWEAVYFDHDLPKLVHLADLAADVGVERFVLDDGWFRGRRDDEHGLGDWYVDEQVWPDGLHPLVEHVRSRGMQFGLWVEPEMVNPDSDLARAHPEWILGAEHRLPPLSRHQQVLDIAHPDAYRYLLERLDALLTEYAISYLKWDHNRDLVDAGSSRSGAASVRAQTLALYALMDELRERHPRLEIESCASGGGRVDLEVLQRTERIWASDCIDPLERQQIQRWTSLLVPPEMIGSHVGAPEAHTTGRTHTLDFRAGSAVFGHFGVEWDLSTATTPELRRLGEWIRAHKDVRSLLHTGRVVRADHPDPALWVHGVVAHDGSRALFQLVQMTTSVCSPSGLVRLPGLDPAASYRLAPRAPGDVIHGPGVGPLAWWSDGITLPGIVIAEVGVQAPVLHPERLVLIEAIRQ